MSRALVVGTSYPSIVLHGTTRKSARAFREGRSLPEAERQHTFSEFGRDGILYVSERAAPHQALMFGKHGGTGYGGRTLVELALRPGARILNVATEIVRVPAGIRFCKRPDFTDDMARWFSELRTARGRPLGQDAVLAIVDPTAPGFDGLDYPLVGYVRARGYAGFRFTDETVLVDQSVVVGARPVPRRDAAALEATPPRFPRVPGSLYTTDCEPRENPPRPAACRDHRHPSLPAPVSAARFAAEFDALWARTGLRGSPRIFLDERLSERHRLSERSYAEVEMARRLFHFAPEVLWLPSRNRAALVAHELGHVIVPRGSEHDADRAARRAGVEVGYDRRWSGRAQDGREGLQVRVNPVNDRSTDPVVLEYAARELFKGRSPAHAAKITVGKLGGQANMFLGEAVFIDPARLEGALWERIADAVVECLPKIKPGMEHVALAGIIQRYRLKVKDEPRLRAIVVRKLGLDPFGGGVLE